VLAVRLEAIADFSRPLAEYLRAFGAFNSYLFVSHEMSRHRLLGSGWRAGSSCRVGSGVGRDGGACRDGTYPVISICSLSKRFLVAVSLQDEFPAA
jgi:hypothetical protein